MSEFSQKHADQRLIEPGYVGFEEGGQLTNAVAEKPFMSFFSTKSKSTSRVLKFLQILEDGRLTDGRDKLFIF